MTYIRHLLVLVALSFPLYSWSFRFSPLVVNFAPSGPRATQVLVIENPGDEKLPVQIEAFARSTNEKGEEVRTKTDDLVVYPEQVVLLPKEKRNVRVTFSGEIANQEKAYRIVASQLPVDFREKNAAPKKAAVNLKFLLQYVASAYVTPEGATAKVVVKEVKKTGSKKLSVTIQNQGVAHRVLMVKSLKVVAGKDLLIDLQTHKGMESTNLLPGDQKTFELDTLKEIGPGEQFKADLVLKDSDV